MKKYSIFFCLLLTLFSCRKDVKLQLPEYKDKVVIEASIEIGGPPVVLLSHSVPYFGDFDFSTPQDAFIKGALVTVSDGSTTDTLKEVYPALGYLYTGFKLLGQQGRTYTVKVNVDGKTFQTSSTILAPHRLDSLYFVQIKGDSLGFIGQRLSEPAGSGDCYRWFAKRLGRDQYYAAPFNSVFDDKFIDGQKFDFSFNRGIQPDPFQPRESDDERGYFKRGDTVVVKFCKIGRKEYDFWLTYYQNKLSNGNPFSSPANVKSMFDNYQECFGAFVAYAPAFDTLIIPKH